MRRRNCRITFRVFHVHYSDGLVSLSSPPLLICKQFSDVPVPSPFPPHSFYTCGVHERIYDAVFVIVIFFLFCLGCCYLCCVVCAPKMLTHLNSGWLFCASTRKTIQSQRGKKKKNKMFDWEKKVKIFSNRPQWPHRNGVFM